MFYFLQKEIGNIYIENFSYRIQNENSKATYRRRTSENNSSA